MSDIEGARVAAFFTKRNQRENTCDSNDDAQSDQLQDTFLPKRTHRAENACCINDITRFLALAPRPRRRMTAKPISPCRRFLTKRNQKPVQFQ